MLEITIQRGPTKSDMDAGDLAYAVVAEHWRSGTLLPIRSEGWLHLTEEPQATNPRSYGAALGEALFQGDIGAAFIRARTEAPGDTQILLSIEADALKGWRWHWLCGLVSRTAWDFLSLHQGVRFSLYLPSLTNQAYPPIGRRDLRTLLMVANPADPDSKYGLDPFDAAERVTRVKSICGAQQPTVPIDILARMEGAVGLPTLDDLARQLTQGSADGPYTILHMVCHGWVDRSAQETWLYLEKPSANGQASARPVAAGELIERLALINRLPHLMFLSVCESAAATDGAQRLGGLAQRLVRELGIPAVIAMTEPVTMATANMLAEEFYRRLLTQKKKGEADRALVEAYAGLAGRPDVNVPALYSRLGMQPLFSVALDRPLSNEEIGLGLGQLRALVDERAPVLGPKFAEASSVLLASKNTDPSALTSTAKSEREAALTEVNALCQEVIDISFNALAQGEEPPVYDARQPFRGMAPFRAEDRAFFFGREALVEKLCDRLKGDNFLAVLGPSGSGKSSVALAGLVPRLKQDVPELQVIDDLTPGGEPLKQLRLRLEKLGPEPLLCIVDQFEELFTLCNDEAERRAFIDALLELAQQHRVVLTMRADFWGECADYARLKDKMQARQELIAPMSAAELRSAMEQQAAKVGLRFEADLSNTLLDEVASEPGAMPLLQHALLELWKRRHGRWLKTSEYRAIGGVKKAIAQTADRIYDALSPADQKRMQDILMRLTQVDEAAVRAEPRRDTRRRVEFLELVPAGSDPQSTNALVKRLADAVLIVTGHNQLTDRDEVEVAHEALIRNWGRLKSWLDENLINVRLLDSVTEAAREYEDKPDDDGLLVHRGSKLAAVEEALRKNSFSLSKSEQSYIGACQKLRADNFEREKKFREAELDAAHEREAAAREREMSAKTLARRTVLGALGLSVTGAASVYLGYRTVKQNQISEIDRKAVEDVRVEAANLRELYRESGQDIAPSEEGGPVDVSLQPADGAVTNSTPLTSSWGIHAMRADESPYDGQGCVVALLDSGVDAHHPAFRGVKLIQKDFTGTGNGDANGHGTMAASVLVGRQVNNERFGVARGVTELLVAKVLGANGSGGKNAILNALQWVSNYEERRVDVICVTFGIDYPERIARQIQAGAQNGVAISTAFREYLQLLRVYERLSVAATTIGKGAVILSPAGNESNPGARQAMTSPLAVSRGVISVGAVEQTDTGYKVADFSNAYPSVCAPGKDLVAAQHDDGLTKFSGTSPACAAAAGVAALWWQALRAKNPGTLVTGHMVSKAMLGAAQANVFPAGAGEADRGAGLVQAPDKNWRNTKPV